MIEAFRKIWRFAGMERANINKSVAVKFLNAVFHMLEVSAIYFRSEEHTSELQSQR